jgi:hypothetical protein
MTANNALVTQAAAYLITDTTGYDDEAVVRCFHTKVLTLPHLGMAISTAGTNAHLDVVAKGLIDFTSFDDFLDRGQEKLRELWDDGFFELFADEELNHFRLFVIGWSEREKRARLVVLCTEPQPMYTAFELTDAPIAINPGIHRDCLEDAGLTVNGAPVGEPEAWLMRLIDIQRARRAGPRNTPITYEEPASESGGSYTIGGHAVLTKLTRHGITQRVVRRWPDKLNCKVEIEARGDS